MSDPHAPCDGNARFKCPCWERGAREEAAIHRARPATRELTEYIRAVGDGDPALTPAEMAERAYRVFTLTEPGPAPHPGQPHRFETRCDGCGEPGYLNVHVIGGDEYVSVKNRAALEAER